MPTASADQSISIVLHASQRQTQRRTTGGHSLSPPPAYDASRAINTSSRPSSNCNSTATSARSCWAPRVASTVARAQPRWSVSLIAPDGYWPCQGQPAHLPQTEHDDHTQLQYVMLRKAYCAENTRHGRNPWSQLAASLLGYHTANLDRSKRGLTIHAHRHYCSRKSRGR